MCLWAIVRAHQTENDLEIDQQLLAIPSPVHLALFRDLSPRCGAWVPQFASPAWRANPSQSTMKVASTFDALKLGSGKQVGMDQEDHSDSLKITSWRFSSLKWGLYNWNEFVWRQTSIGLKSLGSCQRPPMGLKGRIKTCTRHGRIRPVLVRVPEPWNGQFALGALVSLTSNPSRVMLLNQTFGQIGSPLSNAFSPKPPSTLRT